MDNRTHAMMLERTSHYEETFHFELLACHVINVIIIALTLYLSACVLAFGMKTGSWKIRNRLSNTSQLNKGGIYTICVVAILIKIPRLIMTEIVLNVSSIPGAANHCETLIDISNITHYLHTLPIFLFLWYRQHTINCYPTINRIALGKWAKKISFSVQAFMIVMSLLVTIFYIIPHSFDSSPTVGCIFISIENGTDTAEEISREIRDIILAAGLMLNEVALLILFIYPLYRIEQSKKRLRSNTSASADAPSRRSSNEHGKTTNAALSNLIKRSTIAGTTSVTADLLLMIIASIAPDDWPVVILMTIYNVMSTVHVICIIFTFSFYKDITNIFWILAKRSQIPTIGSEAEPSEPSNTSSRN